MDTALKRLLAQTTQEFYRVHARSFSDTRKGMWSGWNHMMDKLEEELFTNKDNIDIGDIACGNMRLAQFFCQRNLPFTSYLGIDNCPEIFTSTTFDTKAHRASGANFDAELITRNLDILDHLLNNESGFLGTEIFDLTCCFGFFHHIPGSMTRTQMLQELIDATKPNGYICVSFWEFMRDKRIARQTVRVEKAMRTSNFFETDIFNHLEEGDHFLGWQGQNNVIRYCHSFDENEIDALCISAKSKAKVIDRWHGDGKNNKLNCYLLLKKQDATDI